MMHEIAKRIRTVLVSQNKTLSTAESCTSGRIAAALTTVSGASNYFQGGIVAYQDHVKIEELGVESDTIKDYDVVSKQVVEQMVVGACRKFHTDYALASTGYADKGNDRVPDGTIWIGWGSESDIHSVCLQLSGTREENTQCAVESILREFCIMLEYGDENNITKL